MNHLTTKINGSELISTSSILPTAIFTPETKVFQTNLELKFKQNEIIEHFHNANMSVISDVQKKKKRRREEFEETVPLEHFEDDNGERNKLAKTNQNNKSIKISKLELFVEEKKRKQELSSSTAAQKRAPFIAWPPVPIDQKQSQQPQQYSFLNQHTIGINQHSTSRCRSHSPIPTTNNKNKHNSTSPFRHIQKITVQSARNIFQRAAGRERAEYIRVPGDEQQEKQSSSLNTSSHVSSSSATRPRLTTQLQRRQQRVRRTQRTLVSSLKPISSACPQNYDCFGEEMIRPYKFDVLMQMPKLPIEELEKYGWDPDNRSENIYVKEDKLTLHRHPVAQSTDCIRGKIGFTQGFHIWQLIWPINQRGTHAVIGVATKKASLHSNGYRSLIGSDTEGYGWDIVENKCYYDSINTKGWTYPIEYCSSNNGSIDFNSHQRFQVPEKIYCILDMDEGQLSFATESCFLGVAFCGLKGKELYPIVSAVWGHCEVIMRYIGGLEPEPAKLMDICRKKIRLQMGNSKMYRVAELNIPPNLKHYLLYNYKF